MIESVPLIQNANDAQQINASIIAMKKASKELDEKILKLNNLNKELDKKIAVLDNGLAQEITDRENADSAEVTNRNNAITNAVNALDVASVGGSGKYISAISETDGKINATVSDLTSVIESGNSQPVTSGGVADELIANSLKNGTWGTLGGARVATSSNFDDLLNNEICGQYNWGYGVGGIVGGSINISSASLGVPAGWYNFLYVPHRNGTGAGNSDNRYYGVLYVTALKATARFSDLYIIHRNAGVNYNAVVFSQKTDTIESGRDECITSNAIANALLTIPRAYSLFFGNLFTVDATVSASDFINKVVDTYGAGAKLLNFGWANANQGYISINENTSIRMNGNMMWGEFKYFKEGYNWTRSNFFITDIDRGVVWLLDISRDTTNVATRFFQL